ncbi:MAG: response regulator [Archangium sp.]
MERRALIVESQNDFALSLASVLKGVGFNTSLAASAGDAQRELEKRRPDIVVLRAELPDQSGFVLCGTIRKGKFGQNLPVILVSSDSDPAALMQHSQGPNAANGYLAIPFEMGELARLTQTIVPPGSGPTNTLEEMDGELDAALSSGPAPETNTGAPPPLKTSGPGGPPRLPRRERRSALTDEDKSFLDRAFGSIADRKTELLAESREVRRPPRRDAMGTPEAKIQILRDELKSREAQIARISEIWSVRERELLSVEDRLNEKDVEIQGLKMQGDDLTRRLNESQNNLVEKEREHGRQVEDLLLQKFIGEKEVIEVVSAKEKEVNVLRREKTGLEDEVARVQKELESARKDYEQLEKDFNLATLEFEVKEKQLVETVQARDASLSQLTEAHEHLTQTQHATVADRDTRFADYEGQLKALTETLEKTQNERDATVRDLESKLRLATEHGQRGEEESARLAQELADARQRASIRDRRARRRESPRSTTSWSRCRPASRRWSSSCRNS